MAKECIVCGKKLGIIKGDVKGILCDNCYGNGVCVSASNRRNVIIVRVNKYKERF